MTSSARGQVAWPCAHAPPRGLPCRANPYNTLTLKNPILTIMCARKNCRIITPKEAQQVLERSVRHVRRLLDDLRFHYNKREWQPITAKEFCDFFGFSIDDVFEILGWN